ncbi:STAS domain-containing protein [Thorsellia kenyensis]|uniref:STAS domain-containing protein n=1 Tax=Thorsellia kenyensis TaxID=1549888 RepID=A0ABV6C6J9_9GAMM
MIHFFDYSLKNQTLVFSLPHAHFWDITAISALEKVIEKYNNIRTQVILK